MADGETLAWLGSDRVVVPMPEEIDATNSAQLGERLNLALLLGVPLVIADFTQTRFSDTGGARELALARGLAAEMKVELRAVVTSASVLRAFELAGPDELPPLYPSLDAALAASQASDDLRLLQRDLPDLSRTPLGTV